MALATHPSEVALSLLGQECEGEVVCVRYWVALGLLSLLTLTMDPLPKVGNTSRHNMLFSGSLHQEFE